MVAGNYSPKICIGLALTLLVLLLSSAAATAKTEESGYCPAAKEVARKGFDLFETDQKKGLGGLIQARKLCPEDFSISYNLGMAYYKYRAYPEARQVWQETLALRPDHFNTIANLAWLNFEMQDYKEALSLVEQGLILKPGNFSLAHTKVQILYQQNEYRQAYDSIVGLSGSQATELRRETAGYMVEQVLQLLRHGDKTVALADIVRLAAAYPSEEIFAAQKEKIVLVIVDAGAEIPLPIQLPHNRGIFQGPVAVESDDILDQKIMALPALPASEKRKDAYAVIIGISRYNNLKGPRFSSRDAKNIHSLITRRGVFLNDQAHIRLLLDDKATVSNIYDSIAWLIKRGKMNRQATLFFYFSGHGSPVISGDSELVTDGLLVPVDAHMRSMSDKTAISINWFKEELRDLPNKEVVCMIDACFTGTGKSVTDRKNAALLRVNRNLFRGSKAMAVAASQKTAQEIDSGRQSAFTYFIMEGMLGMADGVSGRPQDGWVDLVEAFDHAKMRLGELGYQQDPHLEPANPIRLVKVLQ